MHIFNHTHSSGTKITDHITHDSQPSITGFGCANDACYFGVLASIALIKSSSVGVKQKNREWGQQTQIYVQNITELLKFNGLQHMTHDEHRVQAVGRP